MANPIADLLAKAGNGRRREDRIARRATLPGPLVAAKDILSQDPKGRRPLGPIGKAIANAWQEKAQRVHQYRVVKGSGQLARRNKAVAVEPTIKVTDGFGRPVGAHEVRFVVIGGGDVDRDRAETGNDGTASCGTWTLGHAPGSNTIEVWATGKRVASFHAVAY